MFRQLTVASIGALIATLGCDRRSEVQRDTEDLRRAQADVPRVTRELEEELQTARSEVVRLEQKLALARQGITDDVASERKELADSLQEEQRDVQGDINEARREAQQLSQDSERAVAQLEKTAPPVSVEPAASRPVEVAAPAPPPVENLERREVMPVRGTALDAGTDSGR
jgi:gas vesicle protein